MNYILKNSILLLPFLICINVAHAQIIMSNGTTSTCSDSFFDSGGTNNPYGNNEDFTYTICSDNATGDTHVSLTFAPLEVSNEDVLCFYDGDDTSAPLIFCNDVIPAEAFSVQASAINPSGCITVTFQSNGTTTNTGWSAGINCVQRCQTIISVITNSIPEISPPDTGYIDICPGDVVEFFGSAEYPQNNFIYAQSDNTSDFFWDFGDGTTGQGVNPVHAYPNPGGYIVQLTVTDANGCTNTNFISQRIRVSGPPEFNLSEDLSPVICVNDTITIFTGVNDTLVDIAISPGSIGFQTGGAVADSVCVPDGTGEVYESTLELLDFSPGQTLNSIDDLLGICVNMEHSYIGDLEIIITCPSGQSVILHNFSNFSGGSYDLGTPISNSQACEDENNVGIGDNYCWTPDATNGTWLQSENLATGGQLPPGDYSSFQTLSDLVGCSLNGLWTISIEDSWNADDGVIFSWNLDLNDNIYPNLETFDLDIVNAEWLQDPSIFINTADSMAASPQFPGNINYVFEATDNFGCVYDTVVNVTILPQTDPACYNCTGNLTPIQDVTICDDGENAQLSTALENVELTSTTFQSTPNAPFANFTHPPSNPLSSSIDVAGLPYNFTDASSIESVCINVTHLNSREVFARLVAPNGSSVILTSGAGIGQFESHFVETCFTPVATDELASGSAPFTGDWAAEGDFNAITGSQANGAWTLEISDQFASIEDNTFHSWNITFNLANDLNYAWSPSAGLSCDDCEDPVAQPTETTNYEVVATDAYGCTFTESVLITVIDCTIPCNLNASLTNSMDVTCSDSSNGTAEITATGQAGGQTGDVSYELDGTITQMNDGNFAGLSAGPHQVVVTDDNLCVVIVDFVIDAPESMALLLTPSDISCNGANDGSIISSVAGGNGNYSYLWSDGSTASGLNNLSAQTYSVTVTDLNGCSVEDMVTINEPDSILILLNSTAVNCFGEDSGSVLASVSGGTGTLSYMWSDGQTINPIENLVAGNYSLTVVDENNCQAMESIEVTEPATLLQITSLSQTQTSCANDNLGQATVVATGGTGLYTYEWSSGDLGDTVSNLTPDTYTITVTDENSCSVLQEIEIIEYPVLESSITGTNISCNGVNDGTATANGIGGSNTYTYLWSNGQTTATITNLAPGTYTFTITDSNNCTTIDSISLTEPSAITQFDVVADALCFGGTGSAGTFQTGGTYPFHYDWSTGASAISTDSPFGTWNLDDNGCVEYAAKTLVGNFIDTICYTANDGPSSTEAYVIVSVIASDNCMGDNSDTDGDGICDNADPDPNDPCVPNAFDLNNNGVCDFLEPDVISTNYLEIPVQTTETACIGLPPIFDAANTTYTYCNTSDGNLIPNLVAGTYTVTITDDNGCSLIRELTIDEPSEIELTLSGIDVSCLSGDDGEATVVATGGTAPYSYLWSDASQTTDSIAGLTAGTYTVTVTDNNLCSMEQSIVITEPSTSVQIVSLLQTDTSCFGENLSVAMVMASGGTGTYTYAWSSSTQTSDMETNLSPGVHTVTVSDENNCSVSQTIEIFEHTEVVPTITGTNINCNSINDGSATVSATGGSGIYTYLWSDSNMQTTATATGLAPGAYIVTVTDSNNCSGITTITLTEPAAITQTHVITNVLCFGETNGIIASSQAGGTPPYQYAWSTGLTSSSPGNAYIDNLETGTYTLTITDDNNCSIIREFEITQPDLLEVSFTSADVSCLSGNDGVATAIPSGGISPYTYSWSNSQTSDTATDLVAGTHTVTITDANACTTEGTIIITEPATAVQITSISQTAIGCDGSNLGQAEVTVTGGTGAYTYSWSSGEVTPTVNNLSPITYTVTVSDANGCSLTGTLDIVEHAVMSATINPTGVSCLGGNDGTASVTLISGGAGTGNLAEYTYAWSGTSQTSPDVNGLIAGIHTVTITDIEGCTTIENVEIPSPSELTASTSTSHIGCSDSANGVAIVTASGGTAPYTYEWDSETGGFTGDTITGLAPGGYNVTVTDANNCSTISFAYIYQIQAIEIEFDVTDNLCYGTTNGSVSAIVVGGAAPLTYAWSTGFTSTENYIESLATGTYTLTVTDTNGCEEIASVDISDPGELTFDVDVIDVTCYGDSDGSMVITGSGGVAPYNYSFDNFELTPTDYIGGLSPGYYNVAVQDNNGCIERLDSVLVAEPLPLEAIIYPGDRQYDLVLGDSLQLAGDYANGFGGISFAWEALYDESTLSCDDCQFPLLNTYENDRYTLTVTDENGCTDTEDIEIVMKKERAIFVPGAFTPNGDNINDVLMVHGKTGTNIQYFNVYDRWGELVFRANGYSVNSTDADHTWNGEFKGKPMNPGIYVWTLKVRYIDGKVELFEGNTQLLR